MTTILKGLEGIRRVIIYAGGNTKGSVDETGVSLLTELFKRMLPDTSVDQVRAAAFYPKSWDKRTTLLVMPGGRCSAWDEDLGSNKIQDIWNFVHGGGRYYGVCGGAYFASKKSFFTLANNGVVYRTIERERAVPLFPGVSRGPVLKSHQERNPPLTVVQVNVDGFEDPIDVGLMQGGTLEADRKTEAEYKMLASYAGLSGDAVAVSYMGRGSAALSHVHWEYNAKKIEKSICGLRTQWPNKDWDGMIKRLSESEDQRFEALKHILSHLQHKIPDLPPVTKKQAIHSLEIPIGSNSL
jgi:biotin--protein ligase